MKPPVALGAVLLLVCGLLGLVPTAAGAAEPDPEVTVTWPEVTRFNPRTVPYEFTVADAGGGHLFAWWESLGGPGWPSGPVWPVPHEGTATAESWHEGPGRLVIERCPTATYAAGTCARAAESPDLEVYSAISVSAFEMAGRIVKPGRARALVSSWPALPETVWSWQVVDHPRESTKVLASGTVTESEVVREPGSSIVSIPVDVPSGTPSGYYHLLVQASADTADFGRLESAVDPDYSLVFEVDADAPRLRVQRAPATIYPARDGYLDLWSPHLTSSEPGTGSLEVTDARGARVFVARGHRVTDEGSDLSWNGYSSARRMVPEGRYLLKITVSDYVGHTGTWTGWVQVSHQRKQWLTYKRTVSAAASRTGEPLVGKCSTLAKRPRGALGFFSQTKCQGAPEQGLVATNHGIYVPKSYENRYGSLRITMKGSPVSRSRTNYLVMGYVNPRNGKLTDDKVFRRGRSHRLARIRDANRLIFDRKEKKPFVIWSNGLALGSRFVVRSYTVEVRYQVFR